MSSQQRPNARQDAQQPTKKMKKSAQDENGDSIIKQNKPKTDVEPQPYKKITDYLPKLPHQQKPHRPEHKPVEVKPALTKIQQLEEELKEKDKLILELKNRKQDELQRSHNLFFEAKQFKKKARNVIARSMLELAQLKRIERHKKDERLGSFTESMRAFIEGQILITLRRSILAKEVALNKLDEIRRSKSISNQEHVRTISSYEFINRELSELNNELTYREKEVAIYKDRMKLAEKEIRSMYYKQRWPIVYDRYQTLQLLGAGGFGEVYKCYDLETNRIVALKIVINKEVGSDQLEKEDFFRRVQRETDIQKQLSHPNIAAFHNLVDLNRSLGKFVFELECCDGVELSVYLRKYQCLEEKEARSIIRQLFSAIYYLYKLKERVIHYDLKPSNIMYCDGVVKILDFGLCKVMSNTQSSQMELTCQGVGTYWYLPPETFDPYDPMISCKVDVWSLGIIFYELLYGKKPFAHNISQTEILQKNLIAKAVKPNFPKDETKKYRISQSAIQFITLCLKYNHDERPTPEEAYMHQYLKKE